MNLWEQLAQVLPSQAILLNQSDVEPYTTPWRGPAGLADAVIRPGSVQEVRHAIQWAVRHRIRFVPQGANTGLVGAGVPTKHDGPVVVVSTDRLLSPLHIDPLDRFVRAGAGVRVSSVQSAAAEQGLFLPIDLSADASVGGLVSTNAGGSRVLRYGDVRQRTLALQAVLADEDATVIGDLRSLRKRNDGLRLPDVMIGAGGQLGVVVAAVLQLAVVPEHRTMCLLLPARGADLAALSAAVERVGSGRVSALELMSRRALELVAEHLPAVPVPFLGQTFDDVLLVELEDDEAALLSLAERLPVELVDDVLVTSPNRGWAVRHALSEAQAHAGVVVGLDVAVPRARLTGLRRAVADRLARSHPDATLADFGHLGDGGLHLNVVLSPSAAPDAAGPIRELVYQAVQECEGTFSAEHGLGPANLAWWDRTSSPATRRSTADTKRLFDPNGLSGNAELAAALTGGDGTAIPRGEL